MPPIYKLLTSVNYLIRLICFLETRTNKLIYPEATYTLFHGSINGVRSRLQYAPRGAQTRSSNNKVAVSIGLMSLPQVPLMATVKGLVAGYYWLGSRLITRSCPVMTGVASVPK